jgi:hypothetical protein
MAPNDSLVVGLLCAEPALATSGRRDELTRLAADIRSRGLQSANARAARRDSCEKIDLESGTYDGQGHSPVYGCGRPDVARAVELARQRAACKENAGRIRLTP